VLTCAFLLQMRQPNNRYAAIQMRTSCFTQSILMYEVKVKRAQLGSSVMKNRKICTYVVDNWQGLPSCSKSSLWNCVIAKHFLFYRKNSGVTSARSWLDLRLRPQVYGMTGPDLSWFEVRSKYYTSFHSMYKSFIEV
jgi:hypothetical protein